MRTRLPLTSTGTTPAPVSSVAGLVRPDSGDVCFDGVRVNEMPPRGRDVAMVFQQDGLYPHLTVAQSLKFALRGTIGADEIAKRVDEAVALTGIESILDRYPNRLSGGELRRKSPVRPRGSTGDAVAAATVLGERTAARQKQR